eukprot:c22481_g1_i1 orf=78-1199(-)
MSGRYDSAWPAAMVIALLTDASHCQCRVGHLSFCTISRKAAVVSPMNLSVLPFRGFRKDYCEFVNSEISSLRFEVKQRQQASTIMAVVYDSAPSMDDLPLMNFLNVQGRIDPPCAPDTKASVFAVFDKNKKVQYIGISNDIRTSLRILMRRRPEFCRYYKVHNLSIFEHQLMQAIRQQWISEVGFTPMGNSDPIERTLWKQPFDPQSISEKDLIAAAIVAKSKTLKQTMADRGLTQEMMSNPKLLGVGKRDILRSKEQAEEEHNEAEHLARTKHAIVQIPFGGSIEFDIVYKMKLKTNVGWMYDVSITQGNRKTSKRKFLGALKIYKIHAGSQLISFQCQKWCNILMISRSGSMVSFLITIGGLIKFFHMFHK